jgi:hypothetical protein
MATLKLAMHMGLGISLFSIEALGWKKR